MNDSTIAQLHRTLVEALRRSRPNALHRPVTVAEIYQDLVPYRSARSAIGFEMNADYEHAMLRLLAGEGDLARIEPREVRDKLRLELESPNPDVSLYRNYAACDVWVSIDDAEEGAVEEAHGDASWEDEFVGPLAVQHDALAIQEALGLMDSEAGDDFGGIVAAPFQIADDAVEDEDDDDIDDDIDVDIDGEIDDAADEEEELVFVSAPSAESASFEQPDSPSCTFCASDLPGGRMVNFCPFCGSDQSQQPCPSCGEMLDPLWRFCISCGMRVRPLGDHVN